MHFCPQDAGRARRVANFSRKERMAELFCLRARTICPPAASKRASENKEERDHEAMAMPGVGAVSAAERGAG